MLNAVRYEVKCCNEGKPLVGHNYYKCTLPALPTKDFWSVLVYDAKTQLLIKSEQLWPSVHSKMKDLNVCADGSIEIFFGPKISGSKKHNWIQTNQGEDWYLVINIYEPQDDLIKTWKPQSLLKVNEI